MNTRIDNDNSVRLVLSATGLVLVLIAAYSCYLNRQQHFLQLVIIALMSAIFSISIDTFFLARKFNISAQTNKN